MADQPDDPAAHEELELKFSDYLEGSLPEAERAEVRDHLAACPACRRAYAEFEQTMRALGQIGKGAPAPVPDGFGQQVEETIARRSAGRFFGKKSVADRLPFRAIVVVALVVLVAIAAVLWTSNTGSLRRPPRTEVPQVAPGADEALPRP